MKVLEIKKNIKTTIIPLGVLILLSILFHITGHKFYFYQTNKELLENIDQRLRDYTDIFSYLEKEYLESGKLDESNSLSGKTLYVQGSKFMLLGNITIRSLSTHQLFDLRPERKVLKVTTTSEVYCDPSVIPDPLVDLTYFFYGNNGQLLCLSTTILARDLFVYCRKFEDVSSPFLTLKDGNESIFLDTLKTTIYINGHLRFPYAYLFLIIISYILGIAFFRYSHKQREVNRLKQSLKETSELIGEQKNIIHMLKQIADVGREEASETILLVDVINYFSTTYANQLQNKEIHFLVSSLTKQPTLKGNKSHWYVLIGSIMETLVKNSPPGSTFTCEYIDTPSPKDNSVYQIVFKDNLPIFYPLKEKLFDNKSGLEYMPAYDLENLLGLMNLFLNFSFCPTAGNIISIAIPPAKKKPKGSENVISFCR